MYLHTFHCGASAAIATFFRISLLAGLFLLLVGTEAGRCNESMTAKSFGLDQIAEMAAALAARPYNDPGEVVPESLLDLSVDQWRDIRYRPAETLWREEKLPFEVQFLHPGFHFNRIVTINEVTAEGVRHLTYSPTLFNFGQNNFTDKLPENLGFAGFTLYYPIHSPDRLDEVAVFIGASYFRAVGKDQIYGLSARGLTIDTGLDKGEEFPYFREYWLVKPAPEADELVLYALLDSRSVTGAYRFVIHPGATTDMNVEIRLFRREEIRKIGIAPLTSMFFYGENTNHRPVDDFRPEIHNSDGLLVANDSGEVLWRPLLNPGHLFINSFHSSNPIGFGLLQRDLHFSSYQDQESRYDLRPSAWVTPQGDWGSGRVELVQIPSKAETNDNIVAYWVPATLPGKEKPLVFSYRLSWFLPEGAPMGFGSVLATRSSAGKEEEMRKMVIDFKGGRLANLPDQLPSETPIEAIVSADSQGEILDKQLYRISAEDSWRLVFQIRRKPGGIANALPDQLFKLPPIEVRAHLAQNKAPLTETWSYALWP